MLKTVVMKKLIISISVASLFMTNAPLAKSSTGSSSKAKVEACTYPGSPINWIVGYCAYIAETDDEIAIQESNCFKQAVPDLKVKDECSIIKKYKTKSCEYAIKQKMIKALTIVDCLKGTEIKPFVAGGE